MDATGIAIWQIMQIYQQLTELIGRRQEIITLLQVSQLNQGTADALFQFSL